jgi:O-antigen/teichoic acid export membrane protein
MILLKVINDRLSFLLNRGSIRSVRLKKNIAASFFIKIISIVSGFFMVPLCLDYLDRTQYGIWLTVYSILTWFTFFEIGLGNGLRNKLSEALAVKDFEKARVYISTAYGIIAAISLAIIVIFMLVKNFIDWTAVFNAEPELYDELSVLVPVVFTIFCIKFILKLIVMVLYADQRPALANSIGPLGNIIALVIIFILTKTTTGSLVYLGVALSLSPVAVMLLFTFVLFLKKYKNISPSPKYFRIEYAHDLAGLGIKFFFIQISGLILYHSTNIIISHFFGPSEVTPYNISYKLFSTISMIFAIITTPYWSAYTEAWKVQDIAWIRRSVKKLVQIWIYISVAGVIVLIFSEQIFNFWVGPEIVINPVLSFILLVYFILFTFGSIFNLFINGVGKLKLQLYSATISAVCFYPLSFVLVKTAGMGIEGLALAILLTNIYGPLIAPIQFYKIISGKAKGIWNA